MNTRFYGSAGWQELLDELAAAQSDWFAVPGDLDDFIYYGDDQGGPSEK